MTDGRGRLRRAIATGSGVTVGAAAYLLTLFAFGRDLTRTAMGIGYALHRRTSPSICGYSVYWTF